MPPRRDPLDPGRRAANRQTASLAGVAITLLLLVVGLFLVRELHNKSLIEDCLMSGRTQLRPGWFRGTCRHAQQRAD